MHCVLVSHFHWDREWYRTFQAYRARLVDAIDRVLDLLATDPGFHFLLDGQTVLLEDYLAIRPERRAELERGLRAGRLAAGPWYVQPDSLLPSGESHVRNLLLGRRVGEALGPVSRVGYVPDSFGHPAQLPQILAGFGITTFVHWRGSGSEIDALGATYRWEAPDGSAVDATLLREGYFNAACLPADPATAARGLAALAGRLSQGQRRPALLMNGLDHMLPDPHTGAVAEALAELIGARVQRGVLEDAVGRGGDAELPRFRGELLGARIAPLLPGVWSTRTAVKLANRRCEVLLEGWAEPWAALGRRLGIADERPALRLAWQSVLQNQAHDSICGCSLDAVDASVRARFDEAEGLTGQTVQRILERIAGLDLERRVPWTLGQEIVVFNPTPMSRTDVVRMALDAYPAMRMPLAIPEFAPLSLAAMEQPGFTIDGRPVRVVATQDSTRSRWLPGERPFDIELVAADVPAFGCRRFLLTPSAPVADVADDGRVIEVGDVVVAVEDEGTLCVRLGDREYPGLLAFEDRGDRGDSYDFDPLEVDPGAVAESVSWRRFRHPSGIARLEVRRVLRVPAALDGGRERRSAESVPVVITVEARVAPGVPRVDLAVRVDNAARDHRLRLSFPTGRPVTTCHAATTFDVAERSTGPINDAGWVHPAPATFAHQGWVSANGLTVVAPGLPEAEVTADGRIAITILRAVGWLARFDLRSRPIPAGPPMEVPGAQMLGPLEARLSLLAGCDPAAARAAELGLRGVIGGPAPLLAAGAALLELGRGPLVLSAVKPAEDGDGFVVRVLNPTDAPATARLRVGLPVAAVRAVRLDEEHAEHPVEIEGPVVRFDVPARALRSVLLR
jgi:2-O-(6-phospho-alpha-D-mannosyl)-D-glycerate hydrolase